MRIRGIKRKKKMKIGGAGGRKEKRDPKQDYN
jgi:hypothetical protein